jgi:hypothetical protein
MRLLFFAGGYFLAGSWVKVYKGFDMASYIFIEHLMVKKSDCRSTAWFLEVCI